MEEAQEWLAGVTAERFVYSSSEVQRMHTEEEIGWVEGYWDEGVGTYEQLLESAQKDGEGSAQARRLIEL